MEYIFGDDFAAENSCVAFGGFDGLHKGHMVVINILVAKAQKNGQKSVLLLSNAGNKQRMTTREEQKYLLRDSGLDLLIFSNMSPKAMQAAGFVQTVLKAKLGAAQVVMGENNQNLVQWQRELEKSDIALTVCVTQKQANGNDISSEEVAELLQAGKLERASELLGRRYVLMGEVVPGKRMGRTVGMPTANIAYDAEKLLPPYGVYSTVTCIDGKMKMGLTNIGTRPSVDSSAKITIENHILDYSGDLYGQVLALELWGFVRGVRKLNGLAEVKAQVDIDIVLTRDYFAKCGM